MASHRLQENQKRFLDALASSNGIVAKASEITGLPRGKHYKWVKSNDTYKERYQDIKERNVDLAESKLLSNVNKGTQGSIEYYLNTHGKSRGYGSRKDANKDKIVSFDNVQMDMVIDAIVSYTELNDVLLLLGMEQYQFVKFVKDDDEFCSGVKMQISRMLFLANSSSSDLSENESKRTLILRRWLTVLNSDGMSFNTSTMMYIGLLSGDDDYTYDDDFWFGPEGLKILESLREYIISNNDYMLFCRLYFKRVLKKELRVMPYLKVLARFYLMVMKGDRKRFICNLPVRHGKSEFIAALIFFFFFIDSKSVLLHGAYGDTVLKPMRNRIDTALNIDPFFRKLMDIEPAGQRFNTTDFSTTDGGNYLQFTINGQVTGRGGNALNPDESGALILDDVNAPKWKGTQHMINSNEIVFNTLLSRIPHMALLNTQQRIDEGDLTGYMLEKSNETPPTEVRYRPLICYIPFDKNEDTDEYYKEIQRKYPNVDFYGYEEMPYGVINPSMAHYAVKETCPESWHIYLTQYQQIPTEGADKLFNQNMLIECKMNEIGVDKTHGHLLYLNRQEDGRIDSYPLTILIHIDTSQLSEDTDGSDYTVVSVIGVCVDDSKKLRRGVLFEQWQEQDIGIKDFEIGFRGIATKWLSVFPKNDIRLAVEEKSAGSVAKTTAEDVIKKLVPQYNVQSAGSLELKRPAGENKRWRGEQASQLLELDSWFRYYPYDIGMALDTRFAHHGNIQTTNPDHWWHEARYEIVNFTGRDTSTINDDCCEFLFDVSNKMIIDGGVWREFVSYSAKPITELNLIKG